MFTPTSQGVLQIRVRPAETEPVITVITVFDCRTGHQGALLQLLRDDAGFLTSFDGLIGTAFHVSADGTAVVNYAQWSSREAVAALINHPRMVEHRSRVLEHASIRPLACSVADVLAAP